MPSREESQTAIEVIDPLVGTIFDKRFRVEERIAAGGFGAIYRATHVKSGHPIALKVLHPTLASDLGVLARFRREGSTLTSLRNPHTITAYEYGQADKTLFIVLELLHGETLFDHYSTNGPMEWKRVVHIAKQVCESLEEAHAQGIVHRDLKPTNIHIEEQPDDPDFVKVLDFGIAKILRGSDHDSSDITNAGQMIGTLDYMSPEQMVGGQVTGQTDIYTLGILMYEMIAGTRPFPESQNAGAALAAMLKTVPEPLYLRAPVPRDLDAIVMRCLERETQKRYRSVGEVRADLTRLIADGVTVTSTVMVTDPDLDKIDDGHDEATAITTTPAKVLDALRTPKLERKTPAIELMNTPKVERMAALAKKSNPWDDDDERAPTTTRRPDGYEDTVLAARAIDRRSSPSVSTASPDADEEALSNSADETSNLAALEPAVPSIRPTPAPGPTVRPFESRHIATPVPQVVVAPFSSRPASGQMAPYVPPPPPPMGHVPTPGPFTVLPPTPSPYALPPPPNLFEMQGSPNARPITSYDMGQMTARETTIRRLVWIIVLLAAALVGFIVATQL